MPKYNPLSGQLEKTWGILMPKIVHKKFNMRMLRDFGETIFLTKAEAEQKLKEMERD